MEIVKLTEQYRLVDTIDDWKVSGTVYKNTNGSLSISGTVLLESEQIGNFNYSKPLEGNSIFNVETSETNREVFTSAINILISDILSNF